MKHVLAAIVLTGALAAPAAAGWKGPTMYDGPPDLALTAQMVSAGGGPAHFDAKRLVGYLAGSRTPAALTYLTKRYGAAGVDAFFRTFTYAVDDSLHYATAKHIALPAAALPGGTVLLQRLYRAGTLPNGQYDPGYMLEHLVSHPIHMWVMWDIDRQPDFGKPTDETFHIILTDAMRTLAKP
jgi:hypothetical protein